MKYLPTILKVLMALPMLVFGLNKLLPTPFIQMPPPAGETAQLYMQALFGTYLAKSVALIEVIGAILIFLRKLENIGLVLLFPISLNIVLFHLFHDLVGLIPGLLVFVINVILLYRNDVYGKLANS